MADAAVPKAATSIPSAKSLWEGILRGEMGLALGVVGIIVLLIIPVPPMLLDLLLAISRDRLGPDPDDGDPDQEAAGIHRLPDRPAGRDPLSAWA